jgi:hypothetical protein
MKSVIRVALRVAILALGLWFLSTQAAGAAEDDVTVDVPVDVCGVTVAVGADGGVACGDGEAAVAADDPVDAVTAAVDAPVSVCGVEVAVVADGGGDCAADTSTGPSGADSRHGSAGYPGTSVPRTRVGVDGVRPG